MPWLLVSGALVLALLASVCVAGPSQAKDQPGLLENRDHDRCTQEFGKAGGHYADGELQLVCSPLENLSPVAALRGHSRIIEISCPGDYLPSGPLRYWRESKVWLTINSPSVRHDPQTNLWRVSASVSNAELFSSNDVRIMQHCIHTSKVRAMTEAERILWMAQSVLALLDYPARILLKTLTNIDTLSLAMPATEPSTAAAEETKLRGDEHSDFMVGVPGPDQLRGGKGRDIIYGGPGPDQLSGGARADALYGDKGPDVLQGDSGNDGAKGGPGNDTVLGGLGNDSVSGGTGKDKVAGGKGSDALRGGPGNDTVMGASGSDHLVDQAPGHNHLFGGRGADYVESTGVDRVRLGPGDDTCMVRDGNRDIVRGGPGYDACIVDAIDVVTGVESVTVQ